MIMGLRNSVKPLKFFSASAISSLFWIAFLVSTGYGISLLPTRLEQLATQILMIAPVFTLMMALLTLLTSTILKKRARKLKVLVKD